MLLEKAWAKLHGSYALIDNTAFQMEAILETLTGAQCVVINHDDENLWNYLVEAKEKCWIMSGSAANTKASKELLEEMGLAGGFAYAILDVMEVEMKDGVELIIKLRNPWGTQEWAGEWSDSSNIWTEELRKKLDWHPSKSTEEKVFWMSYGDFCHYFSRVQICKIEAECMHSSVRLSLDQRPSCIKVVVNKQASAYITVHQPDKGYYEHSGYEYSLVRLIIAKLEFDKKEEKNKYVYIKGNMKLERELCEEHIFEEGEYLLYIETEKNRGKKEEAKKSSACLDYGDEVPVTLSFYAPKEIIVKDDEWSLHPQFLEKVYSSCALMNGDQFVYTQEGAPQCSKYAAFIQLFIDTAKCAKKATDTPTLKTTQTMPPSRNRSHTPCLMA